MKFNHLVKEIRSTVSFIEIINILVNAALIFGIFYLVLILVNMEGYYAGFPAFIYFVFALIKSITNNKALMVEKNYPQVAEKLRTAIDNRKVENPVVEELQHEVIEDLKKAPVSAFFNRKTFSWKVLFVIVFCFAILLLSIYNIKFMDFKLLLKEVPNYFYAETDDASGQGASTNLIKAGKIARDQDIFGKPSAAALGNKELTLEIKPVSYEVDVRKIEDIPTGSFEDTFPSDVYTGGCADCAAAPSDDIPVEQKELVKNYFKNVAKS